MAFQPGVTDLHVNKLLTELSIGYMNADYIAARLFPIVYVGFKSDNYVSYDQSHWFRDEAEVRAPGTVAVEGGWNVTTTNTYNCVNFAYRHAIPDELRANADSVFNLDREATAFVTDKIQMRWERAWATDFFNTSKWGTDKTGGSDFTKFSDYGASSPIQTLRTYARTVRQSIARRPNVLVMGEFGFDVLSDHPDFIERIKGAASPGSPAIVTRQLLAGVLGLERIEVGSSMYTATAEGTAESSVTYSDIFDDDALLMYVTNSPSIMTPSAGYTFVWSTPGGARTPLYIRTYRDDEARKDLVEGNTYFDQVITSSKAGLFLSDMVD
jgi:hypothetical protein